MFKKDQNKDEQAQPEPSQEQNQSQSNTTEASQQPQEQTQLQSGQPLGHRIEVRGNDIQLLDGETTLAAWSFENAQVAQASLQEWKDKKYEGDPANHKGLATNQSFNRDMLKQLS